MPDKHGFMELNATFVASRSDAWVAGDAGRQGQFNHRALVEHWTGSGFTVIQTPVVPHSQDPALYGMDGTGASDVWAVGGYSTAAGAFRGLIEHDDGTAWTQSASPRSEPPGATLQAVSADSTTDVWAVGRQYSSGDAGFQGLIEHYDGTAWHVVQGIQQVQVLSSVTAVSPTDVWAVGVLGDDQPPVVEHYDGTAWSQVDTPVHGPDAALYGISALSSDDIWAVGQVGSDTLVEHWDGSTWTRVSSPDGPVQSSLFDVSAVNPDDVWAVGATNNDLQQPLAEHWNGKQWTLTQLPGPRISATLSSVSGVSGGPVFAVGDSVQPHQPYQHRGLILQH